MGADPNGLPELTFVGSETGTAIGSDEDIGIDKGAAKEVIVAVEAVVVGVLDAAGAAGTGAESETKGRNGSAWGRRRRVGRVEAGRVEDGR